MTFHAPPQTLVEADNDGDGRPIYLARDLTSDGNLAHICHLGNVYTLRITRNGKLILTK